MKTFSSLINIKSISDAIFEINYGSDEKCSEFLTRLKNDTFKSSSVENICKIILGNVDNRTIVKYRKKCYDLLRCNFQSLLKILEIKDKCREAIFQTNIVDPENEANVEDSLQVSEVHKSNDNLTEVNDLLANCIVNTSSISLSTSLSSTISIGKWSTSTPSDFCRSSTGDNNAIEKSAENLSQRSSIFDSEDEKKGFYGPDIILKRNFWETYWVGNNKSLNDTNWVHDLNDVFKEKYPFCVLVIDWHKCRDSIKISPFYFQANGHCKHITCTKFKFTVIDKISVPHSDKIVHIFQSRPVCHSAGERHRRHSSGKKREAIGEELLKHSPLATKLKMLNHTPDEVLKEGNLNSVPTLTIFHKISSENRSKHDLDKDFVTYMLKLHEKQQETIQGKIINGYIQGFSILPFFIILFSEKQLRYLATMTKRFLYLDATGSIIGQPHLLLSSASTIYYYAFIIAGDIANDIGPLPVAEFISSKHDISTIKHFLDVFIFYYKKISSKIIEKVETDFSIALLQSTCQALNNFNLTHYLQYMFETCESTQKPVEDITILHICSSHFIKTVIKKIKQCYPGKKNGKVRFTLISLMSNLLHCDSAAAASTLYEKLIKIVKFEYETTDFEDMIKTSSKCVIDGVEDMEKISSVFDDTIDEQEEMSCGNKSSPYYQYFKKIELNVMKSTVTTNTENKFYSEEFMTYIGEFIMNYFPLWSAVGIVRFGLNRDSNAPVENYFKILKHDLFDSKKRIPAPRFIQEQYFFVEGRLKEREFPLTTKKGEKRQKEPVLLKEDEMAVETWLKKQKTDNNNRYFRQPKFVKAKSNNDYSIDVLKKVFELDTSEKCLLEKISIKPETFTDFFNEVQEYPKNFPNITRNVNGFAIVPQNFETLMPFETSKQYLDDNIVNVFFSFLPRVAESKQLSITCFDTHFVESILQAGYVSEGFRKWALKVAIVECPVWLIPINYAAHWTLLMIIPAHKILVYYDSLHGTPNHKILSGICNFIVDVYQDIDWHEWTLHTPIDVPSQIMDERIGGNCGVHVCLWAYIIASGSAMRFSEKDMPVARKAIANYICNSQPCKKTESRIINNRAIIFAEYAEAKRRQSDTRMMSKSPKNPFEFANIFEFSASVNLLLQNEYNGPQTRRKQNRK